MYMYHIKSGSKCSVCVCVRFSLPSWLAFECEHDEWQFVEVAPALVLCQSLHCKPLPLIHSSIFYLKCVSSPAGRLHILFSDHYSPAVAGLSAQVHPFVTRRVFGFGQKEKKASSWFFLSLN